MSQFWNGEVLAAPNLITVCVDESQASEISGRLYHGYSQEPQSFENVVQLIRYMADFYDSIRFPESSVVLREFSPEKRAMEKLHEKSVEYQQLMEQSGICATFHIYHQQTDIITPAGYRIRTGITKRYRIQQK